jgi:hypothetical protein
MLRALKACFGGLALLVAFAACDGSPTSPTSPSASLDPIYAALQGAPSCVGLNNARTMGARPRAERDCDFIAVPLETSVATLGFGTDAGTELSLVVTNPNPAPARFYEITLLEGIELVGNTCHGYIPSIAAGASCEMTFARVSASPIAGFVMGKWFTTLADGTGHFGIMKVTVTGD